MENFSRIFRLFRRPVTRFAAPALESGRNAADFFERFSFLFPQAHYIMWSCAEKERRKRYIMEIKITSRICLDELGRPRTFHYALTVDAVEAGAVSWENYGVRVSEEQGDSVSIPGITTSALRIDELISLLVEQGVGPATLRDVVDDWL